jgi:alpha-glucoside transport system permease protein
MLAKKGSDHMATTLPRSLPPDVVQEDGGLVQFLLALIPFLGALALMVGGFILVRDLQTQGAAVSPLITASLAIVWGVGGIILLFVTAYHFVERLPKPWPARLEPWVFVGPALVMLIWVLLLPALRTVLLSFQDADSVNFVGLQNYTGVLGDPGMLTVFRNNLLWMIIGTTFTVSFGLLVAVLADRSRFETLAKALIFLPMAISFVGAGVIWNFVYAVKPTDAPQIGLLNSVVVSLGGQPQAWTAFFQPWNNFFLIAIVIWLQTGYSMVLFSAAIKGMPAEMLEASRVDGANEVQVFFLITIPYIMGTIVTVATTIVIFTLKIFDVVIVMTGGQYGTSVIATEFYRQYFTYNNNGYGSAIATILLIAVMPVMAYNLRRFAQQEVF